MRSHHHAVYLGYPFDDVGPAAHKETACVARWCYSTSPAKGQEYMNATKSSSASFGVSGLDDLDVDKRLTSRWPME